MNGHLNVALPLLAVGGRGAAGYRMTLAIDRKWMAERSSFNGQYYYDATTEEWLGSSQPGYGPGLMQLRHSL